MTRGKPFLTSGEAARGIKDGIGERGDNEDSAERVVIIETVWKDGVGFE